MRYGTSAAGPAARNARRVIEAERECPIAHRLSDGDRPARYPKVGAAKLDRRVHEARCPLRKSERSRVGSSPITNEEPDPLSGVGWRVRNQPDPNEEARWMANASAATDRERCPVDVDTGYWGPAPPVVERSYGRARRLNGYQVVGRARRRSLVRTARPTADEYDDCAQHQRCKRSHGRERLAHKQPTFKGQANRTYDYEASPRASWTWRPVDRTSQSSPFGDAIDTFVRREDAERLVLRRAGETSLFCSSPRQ
jgi:hypothetical protein